MMNHGKIFGTTSMGERGQVVIPADAREELGMKPGEKLVVFGHPRKGSVILVKADVLNKFADVFFHSSKKFERIAKEILEKIDETDEEEPNE